MQRDLIAIQQCAECIQTVTGVDFFVDRAELHFLGGDKSAFTQIAHSIGVFANLCRRIDEVKSGNIQIASLLPFPPGPPEFHTKEYVEAFTHRIGRSPNDTEMTIINAVSVRSYYVQHLLHSLHRINYG